MGWGTGDTEALSPTVTKDKMPYVSASYSAHLTDPKKTPYNLFFATDYSTNARATPDGLVRQEVAQACGLRQDESPGSPASTCLPLLMPAHPSRPSRTRRRSSASTSGPTRTSPSLPSTPRARFLALKEFKPDVVWHGNTTMSVSATMRDAYALGLGADHIVNNWGFDENLPRLAGEAAEGAMGATVCAFFGENVKPMDAQGRGLRQEIQPRRSPGKETDPHRSRPGATCWCSGKP